MIYRMALWLIPVYVTTSPSLSGSNLPIACTLSVLSLLAALYPWPYVPEEMKPTARWRGRRVIDRNDVPQTSAVMALPSGPPHESFTFTVGKLGEVPG